MPILYTLPAIQVVPINPKTISTMDNISCQAGTWNGILIIIMIGAEKGIIESQNANGPDGSFKIAPRNIILAMSGSMIGNINCWVSASLSTAEPIIAKSAA